jgi:hypothetical protein
MPALWPLLLLFIFGKVSQTIPAITLPINAQVPPVARVEKTYNWQFSSTTFSESEVQYSLQDAPQWLKLEGEKRRFFGTPEISDSGVANFSLIARDLTGYISMPVIFIVSSSEGPRVGQSIASQPSAVGVLSGPRELNLRPSSPLAVQLTPTTFTNTNNSTQYYAVCGDNTPLPSWIQFDRDSLSLKGTTPSFDSPDELPQVFEIKVTASDVVGFSAASVTFQIIVDLHQLMFANQEVTVNVTAGQMVNYTGLHTSLTLDGEPIENNDLNNVTAQLPSWLSLDPKTFILSGMAPSRVSSGAFKISAEDRYGDQANTTVYILAGTAQLFWNDTPILNATIGQQFSYTFDIGGVSNAVDMEIGLGNTSSWLDFDQTTQTLSGRVPSNILPQKDLLSLSLGGGADAISKIVILNVVQGSAVASPSKTWISPMPTISRGSTQSMAAASDPNIGGHVKVAAIVLPVVGMVLLLVSCWLIWRKKSKTLEMVIGCPQNLERTESVDPRRSRRFSFLPGIGSTPPRFWIPLTREEYLQAQSGECQQEVDNDWSDVLEKRRQSDRLPSPVHLKDYRYGQCSSSQPTKPDRRSPRRESTNSKLRHKPRASSLNATYQLGSLSSRDGGLWSRRSSQQTLRQLDQYAGSVQSLKTPHDAISDDPSTRLLNSIHSEAQNHTSRPFLQQPPEMVNGIRMVPVSPPAVYQPDSEVEESPRTKLDNYLRERRHHVQSSGFFSSVTPARSSHYSDGANYNPDKSLSDSLAVAKTRSSSTRRKGLMMQQALSYSRIPKFAVSSALEDAQSKESQGSKDSNDKDSVDDRVYEVIDECEKIWQKAGDANTDRAHDRRSLQSLKRLSSIGISMQNQDEELPEKSPNSSGFTMRSTNRRSVRVENENDYVHDSPNSKKSLKGSLAFI